MHKNQEEDDIHTGTAQFETVKAGCGIRFDPETLSDESGFDFSAAENLTHTPTNHAEHEE